MTEQDAGSERVAVPGVYVIAFMSGLVIMGLEMVIGRSFTPYFGGTIFTWGSLISVFLLGMAIGYAGGGHAADARPGHRPLLALFLMAAVPIGLFPLVGEFFINVILDRVEDVRYAALLAAFSLAFVPVALLAAVSPFCVRLILRSTRRSGALTGRLSAINTLGCIVGTLGTSFYLIPNLGIRAIFFLLSAACCLTAMVVFASRRAGYSSGTDAEGVA